MIVSTKKQKKDFNKHIEMLVAHCPGKTQTELFHEFIADNVFNSTIDENYFYDFILAFEEFLYFNYRIDEKYFKYFNSERFFV